MSQSEAPAKPLTDAESSTVRDSVRRLGREIPLDAMDLLARYRAEILQWSRRLNLVSRGDEARIMEAHIVDSFRPLPHLPERQGAWMADLGSGAGFPGVPLKIIRRDLRLTLIESSEKRRVFLAHICRTLGLADAEAVAIRAEDLARDANYAAKLDVVVARAAGRLEDLIRWSAPLLNSGGSVIAYKPSEPEEEIRAARAVSSSLGFSPPEKLPEPDFPWRRGILVRVRRAPRAP